MSGLTGAWRCLRLAGDAALRGVVLEDDPDPREPFLSVCAPLLAADCATLVAAGRVEADDGDGGHDEESWPKASAENDLASLMQLCAREEEPRGDCPVREELALDSAADGLKQEPSLVRKPFEDPFEEPNAFGSCGGRCLCAPAAGGNTVDALLLAAACRCWR